MANKKQGGQQRLRNPMSQKYQRGQLGFDQEIGQVGRNPNRSRQNHQNQDSDLNNDFEIGTFTTDLNAGLDTDFEIGELARDYEFPTGERSRKRSRTQNVQRNQTDR